MIRIETAEAIQFNRVMSSGKTSPLLLGCEKPDGTQLEAVVKFAGGRECTGDSLCAELIASQLAADLGLPTPAPVLVAWDPQFAASVVDLEARQIVSASRPPAFGSTFMTDGFGTWSEGRRLHGEGARQTALAVFFFDAMIANPDRRLGKPNILVRGNEFRLIDHELAFSHYLDIRHVDPWCLGGLNHMVTPGFHIFAEQLKKIGSELSLDDVRAAWAALSDRQIEAYEAALPREWTANGRLASFAIQRIKQCRDRIDDCVAECRRVFDVRT